MLQTNVTLPDILSAPAAVSPARLTQILRKSGAIKTSSVTEVSFHAIGVGLMGESMRFEISYDQPEENAPATVAGKFPSQDANARAGCADAGLYMTEVSFYREIAPAVPIRAPACHYADINPLTHEFGLLLEDVGPARAADQIAGCSREDAEHALRQAANLHAPRFGDATLWNIEWMKIRKTVMQAIMPNFPQYMKIFRDRYEDVFEPELMRVVEGFIEKLPAFLLSEPKRFGLIHGDYRLDNMLFDCKGGEVPLVVLDWQSVAPENPGLDFSYFIGTSYPMELRSRDERDLLLFYHEEMRSHGVKDYGFDAIWHDYRRGAWLGVFTAMFAAAFAKRTDRSHEMFLRMARGAARQMLEHDTLSLA